VEIMEHLVARWNVNARTGLSAEAAEAQVGSLLQGSAVQLSWEPGARGEGAGLAGGVLQPCAGTAAGVGAAARHVPLLGWAGLG
jgi:hypothetical protein